MWLLCNSAASVALVLAWWRLRRQDASSPTIGSARGVPELANNEPTTLPNARQTLALLKARRSIFPKDYNHLGRTITDEDIKFILEAANWAPTHKRTEPWRFVVIRGAGIESLLTATIEGNRVATIEERGGETFEEWHAGFLESIEKKWRPCDVFISLGMLRQANPDKRLPEWEEVAAVACAAQNMHLMATALGLAGYWSSWNEVGRDSGAMASFLGLSKQDGDRCLGFFVLGSSDKVGKVRSGRGSIEEKTRWLPKIQTKA